jgi:DNA-directed RNA polymerase subunit H
MSQSSQLSQIFKSRENILLQLEKQGYDVSNYSGFSMGEVNAMFQAKQMDMLLHKNGNEKKVYVKYHLAKTIRHNNIYEYIDDLFQLEEVLTKQDELIIIVKDEPNDPIISTVKHIWKQDDILVTLYSIKRLQFNILDHELVPPHRVLTDEETIEMKQKFNIKDNSQMPGISRFSPVSLAIGIRPGEICEILRKSKTAISAPFYRVCED